MDWRGCSLCSPLSASAGRLRQERTAPMEEIRERLHADNDRSVCAGGGKRTFLYSWVSRLSRGKVDQLGFFHEVAEARGRNRRWDGECDRGQREAFAAGFVAGRAHRISRRHLSR